eukprot:Lithocolla_globosa_v1_NODE_767_length_3315_cov_1264.642025.p2 type:complete len:150 gc:universal NODE_767_length_3315_cov_1264.642025:2493-2044(-)
MNYTHQAPIKNITIKATYHKLDQYGCYKFWVEPEEYNRIDELIKTNPAVINRGCTTHNPLREWEHDGTKFHTIKFNKNGMLKSWDDNSMRGTSLKLFVSIFTYDFHSVKGTRFVLNKYEVLEKDLSNLSTQQKEVLYDDFWNSENEDKE